MDVRSRLHLLNIANHENQTPYTCVRGSLSPGGLQSGRVSLRLLLRGQLLQDGGGRRVGRKLYLRRDQLHRIFAFDRLPGRHEHRRHGAERRRCGGQQGAGRMEDQQFQDQHHARQFLQVLLHHDQPCQRRDQEGTGNEHRRGPQEPLPRRGLFHARLFVFQPRAQLRLRARPHDACRDARRYGRPRRRVARRHVEARHRGLQDRRYAAAVLRGARNGPCGPRRGLRNAGQGLSLHRIGQGARRAPVRRHVARRGRILCRGGEIRRAGGRQSRADGLPFRRQPARYLRRRAAGRTRAYLHHVDGPHGRIGGAVFEDLEDVPALCFGSHDLSQAGRFRPDGPDPRRLGRVPDRAVVLRCVRLGRPPSRLADRRQGVRRRGQCGGFDGRRQTELSVLPQIHRPEFLGRQNLHASLPAPLFGRRIDLCRSRRTYGQGV